MHQNLFQMFSPIMNQLPELEILPQVNASNFLI